LSACPRCGQSNNYEHSVQTSDSGRGRKIGIIAVIAVVAIVIFALLPVSQIFSTIERLVPDSQSGGNGAQTSDSSLDSRQTTPVTQTEPPESSTDVRRNVAPVLSSSLDIDELREYALFKVNKDRADFGLPPVALSDNQAAQVHAEDVLKTRTISHWMTNGEKPYMTYSRYDGSGSVAQNVATSGYTLDSANSCRAGLTRCTPVNPVHAIDRAQYTMMYDDAHANWGHRDNILDRHHTHVSFGIAYDDYYFAFVQNFENNYVDWTQRMTYDENLRSVSMKGALAESVKLSGINIFYDPLPTPTLYDEHKNDEYYKMGDFTALVVKPPPLGAYYDDPKEYLLIIADRWSINNQSFDVQFSTAKMQEKHGNGVYTVVLWVSSGGDIQATSTAIFMDK
jgi:uncharacterized protein YkwD